MRLRDNGGRVALPLPSFLISDIQFKTGWVAFHIHAELALDFLLEIEARAKHLIAAGILVDGSLGTIGLEGLHWLVFCFQIYINLDFLRLNLPSCVAL